MMYLIAGPPKGWVFQGTDEVIVQEHLHEDIHYIPFAVSSLRHQALDRLHFIRFKILLRQISETVTLTGIYCVNIS